MIAHARAEHPELSVRRLCTLFGVGRTWYYTHPTAAAVAARDTALRDAIERTVLAFPGYGYRRVTRALHREGWAVNHKRVLRVMRHEALLCQLRRRFVATTDSRHGERRYPNLVKDLAVVRPDQVWVADITYVRLPAAFVFLAAILDAYSRRCVGCQLSRTIDTELTLTALERALTERQPPPGLIHHSDQGVQYASGAYVARLGAAGAQVSMSAVGNPYENAKAESFFKTLKREEVYLNDYQTFAEARANLDRFIAGVYNTKRLHSSLGYLPPVEFEAAYALTAAGG
jgi:transposase InsO family protein